jgi:hypothetical protein
VTLGDQNGDGRRDLGLIVGDNSARGWIAYAPAMGTSASIGQAGEADERGYAFDSLIDYMSDVGDQNGDARADIGTYDRVYFTDLARATAAGESPPNGFFFRWEYLQGPVADLNGDGRPELAVTGQSGGAAYLDVFDSISPARVGEPGPVTADSGVDVTTDVDVVTGAAGRRGSGGVELSPRLEIESPEGERTVLPTYRIDDAVTDDPSVNLRLSGWFGRQAEAGTYRLRVSVGNGRGTRAAGPWRAFTFSRVNRYVPPDDSWPGSWPDGNGSPQAPPLPPDPVASLPTPSRPSSPPSRPSTTKDPRIPLATVFRGTAKSDHVKGKSIAERIFGLGGNDTIDGAGGNDFIDGGSGNDKLIGGAGDDDLIGGGGTDKFAAGPGNDWINANDGEREVVDCGTGKDVATVDTKDRVVHCEKVTRNR